MLMFGNSLTQLLYTAEADRNVISHHCQEKVVCLCIAVSVHGESHIWLQQSASYFGWQIMAPCSKTSRCCSDSHLLKTPLIACSGCSLTPPNGQSVGRGASDNTAECITAHRTQWPKTVCLHLVLWAGCFANGYQLTELPVQKSQLHWFRGTLNKMCLMTPNSQYVTF